MAYVPFDTALVDLTAPIAPSFGPLIGGLTVFCSAVGGSRYRIRPNNRIITKVPRWSRVRSVVAAAPIAWKQEDGAVFVPLEREPIALAILRVRLLPSRLFVKIPLQ